MTWPGFPPSPQYDRPPRRGPSQDGTEVAAVVGLFCLSIVLSLVFAPVIGWICLNHVAGLGLNFSQVVGISWFVAILGGR